MTPCAGCRVKHVPGAGRAGPSSSRVQQMASAQYRYLPVYVYRNQPYCNVGQHLARRSAAAVCLQQRGAAMGPAGLSDRAEESRVGMGRRTTPPRSLALALALETSHAYAHAHAAQGWLGGLRASQQQLARLMDRLWRIQQEEQRRRREHGVDVHRFISSHHSTAAFLPSRVTRPSSPRAIAIAIAATDDRWLASFVGGF